MSPSPQKLPQATLDVLQASLEEFRNASKTERRAIISKCSKETVPAGCKKSEATKHKRGIKEWFYNHGRKNRSKKDKVTYIKGWSLKKVVGHVLKAEVEETCKEMTESAPGTKEYISGYQTALKQVVDELSAEDRQRYEAMAEEWTNRSPPVEVQRRAAETHGGRYVSEFARQMYRQLGMRVFVLSAHTDTRGTVSIASHDFNAQLEGESLENVRENWEDEPIMDEWAKYAQSQMGEDGNEVLDQDKRKKKEPVMKLAQDEDGKPILPDPDGDGGMRAEAVAQVVRQFITSHYRVACGNKKIPTPWGSLTGKETEYVEKEYLPEGFYFKEPSKLPKSDGYAYLKFWFQRQEDPQIETVFKFKQIKGKDGEPVGLPVSQSNGDGLKGKRGPGKSRKKGKQPAKTREDNSSDSEPSGDDEYDRSDDEEGNKEGYQEEDQNQQDVDVLASPLKLPFSAVHRKGWAGGQSISRKRPANKRNEPATGPQFDPPNTRRRKQRDEDIDDEAGSPRIKKKPRVTHKKGPPVGVSPDKPSGSKNKRRK